MIRKILSLAIIISMAFHCASRLGFLSYVYENRNNLAYQAGLITEIPIAMCSSDYDFSKGLSLQQDDSKESTPGGIPNAIEIILFAPAEPFNLPSSLPFLKSKINKCFQIVEYTGPQFEIFLPPLGC